MLLEFFEYTHTHTHTHTNTSKKKKIILEKDVKRRREAENYLKKFPGSQGVFCFILVTYDIRDLNTFNCLWLSWVFPSNESFTLENQTK